MQIGAWCLVHSRHWVCALPPPSPTQGTAATLPSPLVLCPENSQLTGTTYLNTNLGNCGGAETLGGNVLQDINDRGQGRWD